ncbi:hypothetical protein [Ilumatobacter coccineus]|uniref:Uncharacterized protein n=1 Tax=Ilumatobacter coccineus (strain NBRC 103263 / KCTC 29153 / YM16-304) TaxID=1313172 RepID=A0A6C7EBZ3_ILUCY|nr:hypothetical protein [Ilumatobacter coccineus]BAN02655.1 hypothetical protein YM304_23410 [Ilumatobacter coccineus YM16-304]
MSSLHDAHVATGWFLICSNAFVGVWALAAHLLPSLRRRELWWATAVAQMSTIVVAAIGALIVNRHGVELDSFHALYGFSTIFAVAILYSYRNSPFIADKLHLLYGLGSLFIMGLGIRSLFLDGVATEVGLAVLTVQTWTLPFS